MGLLNFMRGFYRDAGVVLDGVLDGVKGFVGLRDGRFVYAQRKYTANSSAFSNQTFRTPEALREMRGSDA